MTDNTSDDAVNQPEGNMQSGAGRSVPAWASALGVVAIVLGVFLTAYHGNEWMKNPVLTVAMPENGELPPAVCPEEELEEEGLTLAECEYMVNHVEGLMLSMPDWFPGAMMWLAVFGTGLAFASVIVGGALVNYSAGSVKAAIWIFGALIVIDLLQFIVVVNAGPILRDQYLWHIVLWFLIHLMMMTGVLAGRDSEAAAGRA